MAVARLMRSALKSIIPNWLADRPSLRTGYTILYAGALLCDTLYEAVYEGWLATLPGIGTFTALPYLAQARGLLQGPNEPDAAFAVRLVNFLQTWLNAGQAATMGVQLQNYLQGEGNLGGTNFPEVRIVDRSGQWMILDKNGNITLTTSAFDWDETWGWDDGTTHITGDIVTTWWSDMWIIIAMPSPSTEPIFPLYTGTSDADWLANAGQLNGTLGLGHKVPLTVSNGVLTLVRTWKGAHTWIRAIIWPADSTSFTVATPTADGNMGDAHKVVSGVAVPSRPTNARFWIPGLGG